MSRAGNRCWFLRKLSRKSRFSALRLTAFGTCFLAIANPRRGLAPLFFATRIVIQASLRRILFLNTCWKSLALVNLSRLGKDSLILSFTVKVSDAPCLWRDAHELHCDRRGFACAREIRAFWHASNYSADMYVSCQAPRLTGCRFQQGATMYW